MSWTARHGLSPSPWRSSPQRPWTDRGELNAGNVGTFTLEFGSDGTVIWTSWEGPEELLFTLNGDIITMDRENGERFDCRWSVLDDKFSLMRDEEIGVCPTLFLVKPWTRMPDFGAERDDGTNRRPALRAHDERAAQRFDAVADAAQPRAGGRTLMRSRARHRPPLR